MDTFGHDKVIISVVLSLGITHLLKGVARVIGNHEKPLRYWIHLLWVLYTLLLLVGFWWWEYRLGAIRQWHFGSYLFIIFYITCFYLLCIMLMPEDINRYDSYKDYYYGRGRYYFLLLSLVFLVDLGDTLLKGTAYFSNLGPEYPVRIATHFGLCLVAFRSKKEWFHLALALLFIVYELSWITRTYNLQ